jgi:hypothetical protein
MFMLKNMILTTTLFVFLTACFNQASNVTTPHNDTYVITKTIEYNGLSEDVVIDKPEGSEFDVLVTYHGTVNYDNLILDAANTTLEKVKNILERNDMLIVSVAYPEENLDFEEKMAYAEAGLLWIKNAASQELGITVKKVFLVGHSQGGYMVTRLNTLHATNGVIANAPGPLNLVYRCNLEETGQIPVGMSCSLISNSFGSTTTNPKAYQQRSLLNFTSGYKSDILFVQGLDDSYVHLYAWPTFKQMVQDCTDCQEKNLFEVDGFGHTALFDSPLAKDKFNLFINNR